MTAEVAYRATEAASAAYVATTEKALTDRKAAVKEFLSGHGFVPDTGVLVRDDGAAIGVAHHGTTPIGWRISREHPDALVPNLRTKKGKKISADLAGIPRANGRELLPGGMPAYCLTFGVLMQPGVWVYEGRLFVTWSRELPDKVQAEFTPGVWEQVRLSEFYAAREQDEAKAA